MDDRGWFAERFEANRSHLRGVAYRMLGSVTEADDAVQEAWIRLSRADTSRVDNLRAWLTTIVARVCLTMLRSRTTRREASLETHLPGYRWRIRAGGHGVCGQRDDSTPLPGARDVPAPAIPGPGARRDCPRRACGLPQGQRLYADARRPWRRVRGRQLRPAVRHPRSPGRGAVAVGTRDGDAVCRGAIRSAGGRGGAGEDRLEVRSRARPHGCRLRLLGPLGVPCSPGCRVRRAPVAGSAASGVQSPRLPEGAGVPADRLDACAGGLADPEPAGMCRRDAAGRVERGGGGAGVAEGR